MGAKLPSWKEMADRLAALEARFVLQPTTPSTKAETAPAAEQPEPDAPPGLCDECDTKGGHGPTCTGV